MALYTSILSVFPGQFKWGKLLLTVISDLNWTWSVFRGHSRSWIFNTLCICRKEMSNRQIYYVYIPGYSSHLWDRITRLMAYIKAHVILSFSSKNSRVRALYFHSLLIRDFATRNSHFLFLIYEDMWHQHNRQQAFVVDLCRPLQPCIHAPLASRSYAMEALLLDCSTVLSGTWWNEYPQHWLWVSAFGGYCKTLLSGVFNRCFSQHWCFSSWALYQEIQNSVKLQIYKSRHIF